MRKSRFILKSQSSFRTINSAQTNNSSSKQTHSFGKSKRFFDYKAQCPLVSYGGDLLDKGKGAGIGIGKKSDFTKDLTCSPPSSKYLLKTEIDVNKYSNKGFSLGTNRQKLKYNSYINREFFKTPTSNRYNVETQICLNRSPSFSLGSRTKILNQSYTIQSLNNNPGPGNYRNPQIDREGHRILNSQAQKLHRSSSKSKRFLSSDNRIPGPATYSDVGTLSNAGKYIISKHLGGLISKFSQGRRITQFDYAAKKSTETPGAGTYRTPSQFGSYDSDIYQKFKNLSVIKPQRAKFAKI